MQGTTNFLGSGDSSTDMIAQSIIVCGTMRKQGISNERMLRQAVLCRAYARRSGWTCRTPCCGCTALERYYVRRRAATVITADKFA